MGDGDKMGEKHAFVIPAPLHAHYAGIFRLTVELARRGVAITFVGFPEELARLKTYDEVQELGFNLVPYQESEGTSTVKSFLQSARDHFQPIHDKLLEDQKAGRPGPTCIIGDRTFIWAKDIAKELNIPYYQFFSCGATYVRELQAMPDMFADGTLTMTEETGGIRWLEEFEGVKDMPGIPSLRWREMTSTSLGAEFSEAVGRVIGDADGVIVNSFYELEAPAIDAIRQRWIDDPRGKHHQLFLVGPVSNAATFKNRVFVPELDTRGTRTNWLQWLDEQPPRSVVYVCFGSVVLFDQHQIKELARAMEASEQRFLWVINRGGEEALPPDFVARTRERGLVVSGWVPQLQILAHSSTGGFVTHCGWNSVIESVSSGVPMGAFPQLRIDQFLNCRWLVDGLQIAVEVNPDCIGENSPEPSTGASLRKVIPEELVKVMRLLLSEEGKVLRSRAEVLKEKAQTAIADGGASKRALTNLVECIPSFSSLER